MSCSPMHRAMTPRADEAGEDTDGIGKVGAGAHHGIHERADQLRIGMRRRGTRRGRRQLMVQLDGGRDRGGGRHAKALQHRVHVERLAEGDGAGGTVTAHLHAKVVAQLPKVLTQEPGLQVSLDSGEGSGILGHNNHVINVHDDEHAGGLRANEQAGVGRGGSKPKLSEMGGELPIPLERSLLEAINRATQLPNGASREMTEEALRTLHKDVLSEIPLQECVGDVHRVHLEVAASGKV